MKLTSVITKKGDAVWVRLSDEDDQGKAKIWISVQVPPEELKPPTKKNPGLLQELDEFAFGKAKVSPNTSDDLDRRRERAALSYLKKIIEAEIEARKP